MSPRAEGMLRHQGMDTAEPHREAPGGGDSLLGDPTPAVTSTWPCVLKQVWLQPPQGKFHGTQGGEAHWWGAGVPFAEDPCPQPSGPDTRAATARGRPAPRPPAVPGLPRTHRLWDKARELPPRGTRSPHWAWGWADTHPQAGAASTVEPERQARSGQDRWVSFLINIDLL